MHALSDVRFMRGKFSIKQNFIKLYGNWDNSLPMPNLQGLQNSTPE